MVLVWLMVTWQTPSTFILVRTFLSTRYDWLERSLEIPYGLPRDTTPAIFHRTKSGYKTSQSSLPSSGITLLPLLGTSGTPSPNP